jgi:hypothetical protein
LWVLLGDSIRGKPQGGAASRGGVYRRLIRCGIVLGKNSAWLLTSSGYRSGGQLESESMREIVRRQYTRIGTPMNKPDDPNPVNFG